MPRYTGKTMYLEKPKRPIIWNRGSTSFGLLYSDYHFHLQHILTNYLKLLDGTVSSGLTIFLHIYVQQTNCIIIICEQSNEYQKYGTEMYYFDYLYANNWLNVNHT